MFSPNTDRKTPSCFFLFQKRTPLATVSDHAFSQPVSFCLYVHPCVHYMSDAGSRKLFCHSPAYEFQQKNSGSNAKQILHKLAMSLELLLPFNSDLSSFVASQLLPTEANHQTTLANLQSMPSQEITAMNKLANKKHPYTYWCWCSFYWGFESFHGSIK